MTRPDDIDRLREALATPRPGARPAGPCPGDDVIRAAARGELAAARREAVVDHALGCPDCTIAWRLALEMAREERGHGSDATAVAFRPADRAAAQRRARRWTPARVAVLAAAASLALVAVGLGVLWPERPAPSSGLRLAGGVAIRSLVDASRPLPRDNAVLRWEGPEVESWDVFVTTSDLTPIASAHGLTEPRYRVPPEALAGLPPGARIVWQVTGVSVADRRTISRTFVSTLD
ncbi:MAG: hypothetical protein D6738_05100 [Acidobacteria bacterium]|nr:MAG: hypothetical protein D6738_05100 [Acidobacteriota bacterium]